MAERAYRETGCGRRFPTVTGKERREEQEVEDTEREGGNRMNERMSPDRSPVNGRVAFISEKMTIDGQVAFIDDR